MGAVDFWTIPRLAKKASPSEQVLVKMIKSGEINAFKPGRDWLILPAEAARVIAGHPLDEDTNAS